MVIQILPTRPSKSERIGEALRGGIETLGNIYTQRQQKLKQEQQMQAENEAIKNLGVDVSDIQNPQIRQKAVELALQGKTSGQIEKHESDLNTKMKTFADQLEMNNPNSPQHRIVAEIYRSPLSSEEKSKLVTTLAGVDPFRVKQHQDLQLDRTIKRYNSRIKEVQNSLKEARSTEREPLLQQLRDLQSERDKILDFKALQGGVDEEEESDEEVDITGEDETPKVKFNPKNKEHIAKFQQLDKKFKGDRKKVNAALAREFTL